MVVDPTLYDTSHTYNKGNKLFNMRQCVRTSHKFPRLQNIVYSSNNKKSYHICTDDEKS